MLCPEENQGWRTWMRYKIFPLRVVHTSRTSPYYHGEIYTEDLKPNYYPVPVVTELFGLPQPELRHSRRWPFSGFLG